MTGTEALALAVARLRGAGIDAAPGDARRLLAHALGIDAGRLTAILPDPLSDPAGFLALIDRRAAGEPVARITGRRLFYGRPFRVTADVLDPRPETELLVDLALAEPFATVLDLGTGSGCLLVTLLAERPGARGQGVDLSPAALAVAAGNAEAAGVASRASLGVGDWFGGVAGRHDLIVANPPYIAAAEMPGLPAEVRLWDPALALTDAADGLTAYRSILSAAPAHLTANGRLIVEIGWTQGAAVTALFRDSGLRQVTLHADLCGNDRAVSGRAAGVLPPKPGISPE